MMVQIQFVLINQNLILNKVYQVHYGLFMGGLLSLNNLCFKLDFVMQGRRINFKAERQRKKETLKDLKAIVNEITSH